MSDRLRKSTKKASHLDHSCSYLAVVQDIVRMSRAVFMKSRIKSSENLPKTLFCQEVASNTVSLHYTLKDPGQYGIQDSRLHSDILIRIKEPENFHRKYTGGIETIFLSEIIKGKQAYI